MWELLEDRHWWSQVRQVRLCRTQWPKRKRGKVKWKSTFIARLMAGIVPTTPTPPFLASVLWKTLCTSVMTSRWCGTRVMTTSATENAEAVTPATTPTKTQPTRSHFATAVTITDITARGPRTKSLAFLACRRLASRHEFRFVKWFQHFSAKMRPTRSNVRIPRIVGPRTKAKARFSDRYTPYANFSRLLATFHMRLIFP